MSSSNERQWFQASPQDPWVLPAEDEDGHHQPESRVWPVEAGAGGVDEAVDHHLVSVNPIDQTRADRDGQLISCGPQEGTKIRFYFA